MTKGDRINRDLRRLARFGRKLSWSMQGTGECIGTLCQVVADLQRQQAIDRSQIETLKVQVSILAAPALDVGPFDLDDPCDAPPAPTATTAGAGLLGFGPEAYADLLRRIAEGHS